MAKSRSARTVRSQQATEEAYKKALEVLDKCSTPNGFFASPVQYNALYARDALITSLGGLVSGEDKLIRQWVKSMDTLMARQSPSGQIPNCVDTFIPTRPRLVALGAADASLWFVLTQAYAEKLIGTYPEFRKAADRALVWLKYQDAHEDGLIEQQEATDWMDIIANRGHVLYTNTLYFAALAIRGDLKEACLVREGVNGFLWSDELGYYRPYAWKQEHGSWFDTAANCFAVLFGLADGEQTESILKYIRDNRLDYPYPVRVMHPPIQPGDKDWRDYYRSEHELNIPDQYHNGGVWPWVGGLYIATLVRSGHLDEAQKALEQLALANRQGQQHEWEFNEWIHGVTGEPRGSADQAWSAGMYVYAYWCAREGKEPVFSSMDSPEEHFLQKVCAAYREQKNGD
jgi:glycogen debranching enzyme